MANPEHLAILKQGVDVWNKWRKDNPMEHTDLSGGNLKGLFLHNANLTGTNLRGADLTGAELQRVDFGYADLDGACLRRADLNYADFNGTKLNSTDFALSILVLTCLRKAHCCGTKFGLAVTYRTIFAELDLSEAKGLEDVEHDGPSSIGVDTIFKSKGQIPESFLRGCGVPDEIIDFSRHLFTQPIQYFSCFISYSTHDAAFSDRLYNDLYGARVRIWKFDKDAKWGKTVWGEIDRSIKIYDKLVVICSKNSLQSGPVLREIERALQREDREHMHVLFPIAIDDYVFERWEHERKDDVLATIAGDFTGWDADAAKYDESFKRLLAALQAED